MKPLHKNEIPQLSPNNSLVLSPGGVIHIWKRKLQTFFAPISIAIFKMAPTSAESGRDGML